MKAILQCITIVIICTISGVYGGKKIPEYFKTCKRSDPNLEDCLEEAIQYTVSCMRNKIPGIRNLEPTTLDLTKFNFTVGNMKVEAVMNKSTIKNLSYFDILSIRCYNNCYIIDIIIPFAKLVSNGSLTTDFMKAEGELLIEGVDINLAMEVCGKINKEKNTQTFHFDKLLIMLEMDDFNAEIKCNNAIKEKLVNLGFAFTKWKIWNRVHSIITAQATKQLKETINLLTDGYDYLDLFPY